MFDIDVNDGPLATNKIQMQILFVSSSISACFACKFYCLQVEIIKTAIYIRSTHTNCMIRLILDIQGDDSITRCARCSTTTAASVCNKNVASRFAAISHQIFIKDDH